MTHKTADQRIDDRLGRLLEVEQRLEGRLRASEAEARTRVQVARQQSAAAAAHSRELIERLAAQEQAADLDEHARQLAVIAAESAARVKALSSVTEERVDALARAAVTRSIGGPET